MHAFQFKNNPIFIIHNIFSFVFRFDLRVSDVAVGACGDRFI